MGQHKLLSLLVLVVGAGGIGPTLLLLLATIGVGLITVVDHDDMEVYNFHWQLIHTKGRRGTSKASSTRNNMKDLNLTVWATTITDPLT